MLGYQEPCFGKKSIICQVFNRCHELKTRSCSQSNQWNTWHTVHSTISDGSYVKRMVTIHRESQATATTSSITFSVHQTPIKRLMENITQNSVLRLTIQYLLFGFTFLRSFSFHPQNYRLRYLRTTHLEPKILNVFGMSPTSRASPCLD